MNSTNMWVLTNGLDGGIAKIVGDAVRLERERRYILRSQAQDPYLKLTKKEELDELPKMTVIGVVPKLQLDCSASLEGIVRKHIENFLQCRILQIHFWDTKEELYQEIIFIGDILFCNICEIFQHDSIISLKKTGTKEAMELNGEHSHFIIMDQNTDMKELENFRLRVEERLLIPIGRGKKYRKIKMFDPTLSKFLAIKHGLFWHPNVWTLTFHF